MWLLFLITGAWLSGTLFVPALILLRWLGRKFRRLHWLVRSRKSWVLIWGSYGAIKTVVLAVIMSFLASPYYEWITVGWSGDAAEYLLESLHIHLTGPFGLDVTMVVLVTAILEGAVCCGLAALAWWGFDWAAGKRETSRRSMQIQRYTVSVLLFGWLLGAANYVAFKRPAVCFDCYLEDGVPFHFYQEGGFAHDVGFLWSGVVGDLLLVVAAGLIVGFVWNLVSRRRL